MPMANANPLTLLADALAAVSKTAYHALSEVELQAREEVARALDETRKARSERDNAIKGAHSAQLETKACKHELAECKATLQEAELTIAHQTEKIAQFQRELSQWKDQSRNWQEHFLRVEQERCALSSRIEELVSERMQWIRMEGSRRAPYTPKLRYPDGIDSGPSSSTAKLNSIPSPTNPPPYKSVGKRTESPTQASLVKSSKPKPKVGLSNRASKSRHTQDREESTSDTVSSNQKAKSVSAPRQTVIRRVQAVIHLKQESEDEPLDREEKPGPSEHDEPESPIQSRRRRRVVEDDEDYQEGYSDVDHGPPETEDNDEDDEDELMMGAEDNHEEVYSVTPVHQKAASHPKKRRKTKRS